MDAGAAEARPGDGVDGDDGEATGDGDDEASLGDDEASLDAGPGWQTENDAALTIEAGVGNDAGVLSLQCLSLLDQDLVFDPSPQRPLCEHSRQLVGVRQLRGSHQSGDPVGDGLGLCWQQSRRSCHHRRRGRTLYVGIDGAYSLVEVALATGEVSAPVYLGTSPTFGGPTTAGQPGRARLEEPVRRLSTIQCGVQRGRFGVLRAGPLRWLDAARLVERRFRCRRDRVHEPDHPVRLR